MFNNDISTVFIVATNLAIIFINTQSMLYSGFTSLSILLNGNGFLEPESSTFLRPIKFLFSIFLFGCTLVMWFLIVYILFHDKSLKFSSLVDVSKVKSVLLQLDGLCGTRYFALVLSLPSSPLTIIPILNLTLAVVGIPFDGSPEGTSVPSSDVTM